MAKPAPRPKQRLPRVFALAGLAVVAVIAVVLVALAMADRRGVDSAGTVPQLPTIETEARPDPTPTPEPAPAPELPAAPVSQRLLAVGAEPGHLLRAAVGVCPDPVGSLEVSFDDGASWAPGTTGTVQATRLMQLDVSDPTITRLVSLNAECAPQVARSFVGGISWEPDGATSGTWFIDPVDAAMVHAPAGVLPLPCPAVGLASQGARAAVLCSDATVTTSEDGGANWSAPLSVPYAVAVGVGPESFTVASGGEPECVGVRTRTLTAGAVSDPGSCIAGSDGRDGQLALAAGGGLWYLWVGDALFRSGDGGAVWG